MIKLTELSETHKDSLIELLNNENVAKWLLVVPFPYLPEDADYFINKCKENKKGEYRKDFAYAVENDGTHIGGIGLHLSDEHKAEVGYWLGEKYWGNGYMTKALKQILDFGFNELKLVRITAHIFEGNIPSEKLLGRCGFEYEGFMKKMYYKNNEFLNSKLFAKVI